MSQHSQIESDDELEDCPICVEPFDDQDRLFLPCHCNYRVCMFCVRRLMTEFDGRCPGCRAMYNEANFRIREIDPEELAQRKAREKQRIQEKAERTRQSKSANAATSFSRENSNTFQKLRKKTSNTMLSPGSGPQQDFPTDAALIEKRKNLANVRVVQPHVVFVLGLPPSLAKEDVLRRPEHFGQYGPILKIVVGHPVSSSGRTPTASAHITFSRADDALSAIQGVNGMVVDGHQIRAASGTTRYCNSFLRGQTCGNPECLFLHQEMDSSTPTLSASSQSIGSSGRNPSLNNVSTSISVTGIESSNQIESLNGQDIAQFEKQKVRTASQTMSKAPGEGINRTLALPTISYDCTLSFIADLVVSRVTMSEELRRKLSLLSGPRTSSHMFSGLECVLATPDPLFVASAKENLQIEVRSDNIGKKPRKVATRSVRDMLDGY